jgi:ACS family tartrate transporter-like MFS transporter
MMGQPVDEVGRTAMRKALWRILPLILLAYLCANMDRINVGFAAVQMNVDLSFSATVYGLGAGLFFLSYALFEIPSNLLAVRYGSRRWLARIMISWGLISMAMMFVRTPMHFYVMRFLLGVAEAGFFPGVIYYFGSWFPASHRGRAISRFYVAAPLSAVVMGAVSGALLNLSGVGGLRGWQWLFLVEGIPSVIVGLMILRFLPDRPATASWLDAREKAWIEDTLKREADAIGEPLRHDVLASLCNPRVLLLAAVGFFYLAANNTLALSTPLILLALTGLDTVHVGYIVTAGGVIGAIVMLVAGNYGDRKGDRYLNAFWFLIVMAGAAFVLAAAPTPVISIIAYLAFAAACFAVAMFTTAGWGQILHVRELAVGSAAVNGLCQLGAFLMPYAWGAMRDATGNFAVGLFSLGLCALVSAGLCLRVRAGIRARGDVPAA